MAEFVAPSFLDNQSVETIHKRMLENLPDDLDKSEGSFVWDNTFPTAYEKSYFSEYLMSEAIKLIFPMFSEMYYEIMDYHAASRGIKRKPAGYATGVLTINGTNGTVIPSGTEFSTVSVDNEENVLFHTTETAEISGDSVQVHIQANEAGLTGNVSVGTIILKQNNISGISSVINETATSGGTEEESTEDLCQRIVEYDRTQGFSFVASVSDYKRWALEVPGTGNAVVIPAKDDSGLVKIVLTDSNGDAANADLCTSVYNHIMSPDDPALKLAPCIGAILSVIPPSTVAITVSSVVELDGTSSIDNIKTEYLSQLKSYLSGMAADEGEIKYTKVGSILSGINGVKDYKNLLLNSGTSNISIQETQLAVCNSVNLTTGEV